MLTAPSVLGATPACSALVFIKLKTNTLSTHVSDPIKGRHAQDIYSNFTNGTGTIVGKVVNRGSN